MEVNRTKSIFQSVRDEQFNDWVNHSMSSVRVMIHADGNLVKARVDLFMRNSEPGKECGS